LPPPSLDALWAALAIAIPVAATWLSRTQAVDLAYQVRAGGSMLDSHRLLTTDLFTFTVAGHSWLNQQWLAEVFFAAVWRAGGWNGIAAGWGLIVGAASLFVFLACRSAGASTVSATLLTLAGYLVGVQILTMRPQLLGVLLFTCVQWIVATRQGSPRRLWIVPLLVLVWTNLHGSFVLAFVLLGFAWLDDYAAGRPTARRVAIVGVTSAVSTLVNPFGIRVWSYVVDVVGNPTVSGKVAEWAPPSARTPIGFLFLCSVLASFAVVATSSLRASWRTVFALSFFALLGMTAIRGVVWWALAFPPLVAPSIRGAFERPVARSWLNAAFLLALCGLLILALPFGRGVDQSSGGPAVLTFAPEDLVADAARAVPPGTHVFASEVYGSWVEFSAPQLPVFVDPRVELFPDQVWNDYFIVSEGRVGWDGILARWDVRVVILHPSWASGLLTVIRHDHHWRLLARSSEGAVYLRV
jgi:xanthosine utilization system XapX-like protein